MNLNSITTRILFLGFVTAWVPSLWAKDATEILADQSDAVVVAQIQSGKQTGNTLAFNLSIARNLKGCVGSA